MTSIRQAGHRPQWMDLIRHEERMNLCMSATWVVTQCLSSRDYCRAAPVPYVRMPGQGHLRAPTNPVSTGTTLLIGKSSFMYRGGCQ
jgi:hypothetical protein